MAGPAAEPARAPRPAPFTSRLPRTPASSNGLCLATQCSKAFRVFACCSWRNTPLKMPISFNALPSNTELPPPGKLSSGAILHQVAVDQGSTQNIVQGLSWRVRIVAFHPPDALACERVSDPSGISRGRARRTPVSVAPNWSEGENPWPMDDVCMAMGFAGLRGGRTKRE